MLIEICEDLRSRVQAHRQKGNLYQLARKGGVSYDWLVRFGAGVIPNPGVRTLGRLEEGLKVFEGYYTHHS